MALLHVAEDAQIASAVGGSLRDAGVDVVDAGTDQPLGGLVVVMSLDSVVDRAWQDGAAELPAARIVPLRVDMSLDAAHVPKRIERINWIDWRPETPAATFGFVLAGLYADPDRLRMAQQLAQQALVWQEAGRSDDFLISDVRRAERVRERLEDLEADPLAKPGPSIRPFVEASMRKARKVRRRRRGWRALAVLVALGAASMLTEAIPEIRLRADINNAAIATAADPSIIEDQPEWAAANAAALLIHGTETQRALGRATITRTLVEPWGYSHVGHVDSIRSMVSFDEGRKGAAITFTHSRAKTGFVLLDLSASRWTRRLLVDGEPGGVDITPDESTAVVAGTGILAVDIRSSRVRRILSTGSFADVRAGESAIAARSGDGAVHVVGYDGREIATRAYESVLNVGEPTARRALALVREGPRRVAIVDVVSGRTIARAPVARAAAIGSLSPGGSAAIVTGPDRQLWRFDRHRRTATGIPVPAALNDLAWIRGNRLILLSDSDRGRVVLLPRGELLGPVCRDHPSPNEIRLDRRADVMSCGGNAPAFWRVPPGPRERPPGGMSSQTRDSTADITVETKGSRVRLRLHGRFGTGSTRWSTLLSNEVRAVKVSPSGDQVAVGSVGGDVAVLGVTSRGYVPVGMWEAPDAAPVVAVGWDGTRPVASAGGRHWDLPGCPGCQSDEGLLDAMRSRAVGCLSPRQLEWVSEQVRRRIGVRVCDPIMKFEGP